MDEAYFFFMTLPQRNGRRRGEFIELEVDSGSDDRERMLHREEPLLEVSYRLCTLCILNLIVAGERAANPFWSASRAANPFWSASRAQQIIKRHVYLWSPHHGQVDNCALPFCFQLCYKTNPGISREVLQIWKPSRLLLGQQRNQFIANIYILMLVNNELRNLEMVRTPFHCQKNSDSLAKDSLRSRLRGPGSIWKWQTRRHWTLLSQLIRCSDRYGHHWMWGGSAEERKLSLNWISNSPYRYLTLLSHRCISPLSLPEAVPMRSASAVVNACCSISVGQQHGGV